MGCSGSKDDGDGAQQSITGGSSGSFESQYTLGKKLGSGTFSVVKEGQHKATGKKYAIKIVKKAGLTQEDKEALEAEIEILRSMDHPNIMVLEDHFEDKDYFYLVTELLVGGELFDRVVEKEFYSEREARDLVRLLLEAICYCHERDVVHRDLKPENLLLTSRDDDFNIKIGDFGFAKRVDYAGEGLSTACGTPGYVAPEILHGKRYGKGVDIWSIGIITYILLCGYPPFHHDNHTILFKMIKKGEYEFDSPYWDHVTDDAKEFIRMMLAVDPAKRASAQDLMAHAWIQGDHVPNTHLESAVKELKAFNARRKFRAAVKTVQTVNRMARMMGVQPAAPSEAQRAAADQLEEE